MFGVENYDLLKSISSVAATGVPLTCTSNNNIHCGTSSDRWPTINDKCRSLRVEDFFILKYLTNITGE